MDNLFEILVPVIFAAIYFFGNMFSGKSGDDASPENLDSPDRSRGRSGEDPEAVERQRRIQDEIRRKIAERRGQTDGAEPRETAADRSLRERRAAREQRRVAHEPESREPASRIPQPASRNPEPAARRPVEEGAFSWDQSDDIYANSMQKRLEKIEATKRQAAKLQKQAGASRSEIGASKSGEGSRRNRRSGTRLSGPVRQVLNDPAAARTAFIYGEVLGTPTSMKKAPTVPGLS